jgi:hypothetical protein
MNKIKELLERAFALNDKYISDEEQSLRNGLTDADTIVPRAIGYTWGIKDEHSRIAPLAKEIILELAEALDRAKKHCVFSGEDHNELGNVIKKTLAKVEARLRGEV